MRARKARRAGLARQASFKFRLPGVPSWMAETSGGGGALYKIANRFYESRRKLSIMEIKLNLFATLARYMPDKAKGNSCTVEVGEGTRVGDLLRELKLPANEIKLVFLNGVHARGDEILKDGDRVGIFSPIGGG
jgi:molybdopterin synthase sulfur carrier subunit